MPSLQPTVPEDVPPLIALAHETGVFKPLELETLAMVFSDYFAQHNVPGHRCETLVDDNRLVGFSYYAPEEMTERSWYLYWIVVAKSDQGRGFGSLILRHVEDEVRRAGGQVIFVETSSLPHYDATHRFYLKHRYEKEAQLRDYYARGDHMIIYRKDLSNW